MSFLFTNNATGTLANTLTIGTLTLVLDSGQGALFPTPTGGDTFRGTLEDSSGNTEIVSVTARSSDSLTIVRAQEGTADQQFIAGSRFEIRMTADILDEFVQSLDAATLYAPYTHFQDNGDAAEQHHAGVVATETTVQGQNVRRVLAQSETNVALLDDAGVEEGRILTDDSKNLKITNKQLEGHLILEGTDTGGTPVTMALADPDGGFVGYFQGIKSHSAFDAGLNISGLTAVSPWNTSIHLLSSDHTALIGDIGFPGGIQEFRIISYPHGEPMRMMAADAGGTLVTLQFADPDGRWQAYFANSKKIETTTYGALTTGTHRGTGAPSNAADFTRKDYVDAAVSGTADGPQSLAQTGYQVFGNGLTIQWGRTGGWSVNSSLTDTFPRTFTQVFSITMAHRIGAFPISDKDAWIVSNTNSSVTFWNNGGFNISVDWIAMGKS